MYIAISETISFAKSNNWATRQSVSSFSLFLFSIVNGSFLFSQCQYFKSLSKCLCGKHQDSDVIINFYLKLFSYIWASACIERISYELFLIVPTTILYACSICYSFAYNMEEEKKDDAQWSTVMCNKKITVGYLLMPLSLALRLLTTWLLSRIHLLTFLACAGIRRDLWTMSRRWMSLDIFSNGYVELTVGTVLCKKTYYGVTESKSVRNIPMHFSKTLFPVFELFLWNAGDLSRAMIS